MGKKLDLLLGRSSKPQKLKLLVNLALSRLSILKNQRHVRYSQASSDVIHLLQLGDHERALHRVERVIEDQKLLDSYGMIEAYCSLLIERVNHLEQARECPYELKEAVWGLVFASSRCGSFPELQEIRSFFSSQFGSKFATQAIEFPNASNVHPLIIEKLSTRQPSLESRRMSLNQLASENRIALSLEENTSLPEEREETVRDNAFSDLSAVGNYKDAAEAAQVAFEAAAYAAAAARVAVELYRSESKLKFNEELKSRNTISKFDEFRMDDSTSNIDSATQINITKKKDEERPISKLKIIFSKFRSHLKGQLGGEKPSEQTAGRSYRRLNLGKRLLYVRNRVRDW